MTVDITNWREPDHNVWGFQNVDKIVPTSVINKSSETAPLPRKPRTFDNFKLQVSPTKALDLAEFLSSTETDGLVLLKGGAIVFEHYDRTNTEASVHATFSISKSVTGLVCGILAHRGKLKTSSPVSDYVPEVKGSAYEGVTVQQLLDMRAGITHNDAAPGYRSATGLYPSEPNKKPTNLHEYIPTIQSPTVPPVDGLNGAPFDYISANADLMGWAIERVTGQKFAQVLIETVWQPIGAESDARVTLDPGGNARTAAGFCATARDIARLGHAVIQAAHGKRGVFPPEWISDMFTGGSEAAFAAGSERSGYEGIFDSVAYRSFWVVSPSSQILMASGTNGQLLVIDCKNDMVMSKMSSQPARTDWAKIRLTMQAFREFTTILGEEDNDQA